MVVPLSEMDFNIKKLNLNSWFLKENDRWRGKKAERKNRANESRSKNSFWEINLREEESAWKKQIRRAMKSSLWDEARGMRFSLADTLAVKGSSGIKTESVKSVTTNRRQRKISSESQTKLKKEDCQDEDNRKSRKSVSGVSPVDSQRKEVVEFGLGFGSFHQQHSSAFFSPL